MKVLLVTMAVVGLAAVVICAPEFGRGRGHHEDDHHHRQHRGINGEPCRPAGSNRTVGNEQCVCVQKMHEGWAVSRWQCRHTNATTTTTTAPTTTTVPTTASTTTTVPTTASTTTTAPSTASTTTTASSG